MREPRDFFVKHGMHAFIFQLIIGMRMVFILINPILWLMTISYFILNPLVGSFIESLYPTPVFYIAVFCLVIANFMHFYNYMIGCAKRGYWDLVRYVFLIPFYWFSTSLASCIAFYQLAVKPHFWEKTEHGLHLAKHKPSFTEVKLSLDLETRSPHIVGNIISKILSPLVILFNNIMDFIDVLGPLPNLNGKDGLKIMIFNWRDTKHVWSGSAEVYVQELAKRWVASGHNVTIFCGWDGKTQREDNVDGVSIIRRGGFYTVYIFAFLYYIIRFKNKFDIVIDCENGIPFFSPLYANTPKLLLFHHVHQEVLSKHLRFPLSNIALFLESTLMPLLYQNTRIITVSESSKADIVERGWNNGQDVGVVNPGIFLNKETDYSKTPHPSFLYFGRLRAYKNVDVAIRAFARIISKHPEAKLTIAGTGETYFDLIKYTKSLGLGDSVIFTGRVSEEEKLKLLSQSWVALQPSSFEEWGITVLEANACGTPVIASDVKGLRDSVRDGQTGYLVEPKNADILSRAMEYLILNPLERNRLEKNSLFWSKYFSWDKSAWEFLTFINDELERKKRLIPSYETVRTEV
jgi:glycosyltransferase involved in cell wall biosynthesis